MEHANMMQASHHDAVTFDCHGDAIHTPPGGSWQGHVLPGFVFIIWGSYWFVSTIFHMHAAKMAGKSFRAQPWYPFRYQWMRYLEPFGKIILPCVAVSIELYFDHLNDGGFQHLFCPSGTERAGQFDLTNLNNWAHAASYPAFILSGIVDVIGIFSRPKHVLPEGAEHAALTAAFGVMSFLMGVHEKHEPQDKAVHWLLFVAMGICTAILALEIRFSQTPLISLTRGMAAILIGSWLVQVGKIEFEDHPQWDVNKIPEGVMHHPGAMMAPVYFAAILVLILLCGLISFLALSLLIKKGWISVDSSESLSLLPYGSHEEFLNNNIDGGPYMKQKKSDAIYHFLPQADAELAQFPRKREMELV